MSAIEILRKMQKYNNFLMDVFGFNIFKENYGFTFRQGIVVSNIFTYIGITVYNVYLFRNDFVNASFILVTFGFAIQGTSYVFTAHYNRKVFRAIEADVYKYNEENAKEALIETELIIYARINYRINFAIRIVFYFSGFMALVQPVLVYLFSGKVILPYGFVLPWIDNNTILGYTMNYLHHIFETAIVCVGMNTYQSLLISHILNCCLQINVIKIRLKELSDFLEVSDPNNAQHLQEIKTQIRNIVVLHQDYIKFITATTKTYQLSSLIDIFTTTFQMCTCLLVVNAKFWFPGYCLMAMVTVQLLFNCVLGTLVTIKNDQLQTSIYEVNWYMMPLTGQKILMLLLGISQRPVEFRCGGIIPLNVETFLEVYKKIYSFLMVLQNFH